MGFLEKLGEFLGSMSNQMSKWDAQAQRYYEQVKNYPDEKLLEEWQFAKDWNNMPKIMACARAAKERGMIVE